MSILTEKQKSVIGLLEELLVGLKALDKAWDEAIDNALLAGDLKPTKKAIDLSA